MQRRGFSFEVIKKHPEVFWKIFDEFEVVENEQLIKVK